MLFPTIRPQVSVVTPCSSTSTSPLRVLKFIDDFSDDFCISHYGRPAFVHANLIKQIPSGIGKGYAWGKTRSVSDFPTEKTLGNHREPQPAIREDFDRQPVDLDIDIDMLANADDEGVAVRPAPPAVRRRAALERGIKGFFHGGFVLLSLPA